MLFPRQRMRAKMERTRHMCVDSWGIAEDPMLGTIVIIVLVLILLGALPAWPYSRSWGYYPSGGLGLVLVIIIVLVLLNRV